MRRSRVGRRPPAISKFKAVRKARLDTKMLEGAYRRLVAVDLTTRLVALRDALSWYDAAIQGFLMQAPPTPEQQTRFEKARKARTLAEGTSLETEQEAALVRAVKLYEANWPDRGIPVIANYYAELDSRRADLEAKAAEERVKTQAHIDRLNGMFGKWVRYEYRAGLSDPRTLDLPQNGEGVPLITLRKDGFGEPVTEASYVLKVLALERDSDGSLMVNPVTLLARMDEVLAGVLGEKGLRKQAATRKPREAKPSVAVPSTPPIAGGIQFQNRYRPGTCKWALCNLVLRGGTITLAELKGVCRLQNSSDGPIHHVLREMAAEGVSIQKVKGGVIVSQGN